MPQIRTPAELQALAERLEIAARLRDAAAMAPRLIEDESDILRVQRLIDSAADLRAAARVVWAMAKLEGMKLHEDDNWSFTISRGDLHLMSTDESGYRTLTELTEMVDFPC